MTAELMTNTLTTYLDSLVPPRPVEMQKMEAHAEEIRFPIIGSTCGYLCYQLARMVNARKVFEMGSGYGYSTAWFARAVRENGGGVVHHVVWDEDLSGEAQQHLSALGYDDLVQYHVGEAINTLKQSSEHFDLIFNDINKEAYPQSLPVIKEKLRPGGLLIVDNILWGGSVLDDTNNSPSTEGVREFTQMMQDDPDWIVSIIPIRDGIMTAYRR